MKNYYWDAITSYMNDDLREQVHAELAPCSPKDFLARYMELDTDFQDLLDDEFSPEYVRAATMQELQIYGTYDAE